MLVLWMAPAETEASDLSPKATVQPLSRAVGRSVTGTHSGKPTFLFCTNRQGELWKGGYGRRLLSSSSHWWLARDVVQIWAYILPNRR